MTAETLRRTDSSASTSGRPLIAAKTKEDLVKAGRQKLEAYRSKKKSVQKQAPDSTANNVSPAKASKERKKPARIEKRNGAVTEAWGPEDDGNKNVDGMVARVVHTSAKDQSPVRDSPPPSFAEENVPFRESNYHNGAYPNGGLPVLPFVNGGPPLQLPAVMSNAAADVVEPLRLMSPCEEDLFPRTALGDSTSWLPIMDEPSVISPDRAREQSPALPAFRPSSSSSSSLFSSPWGMESNSESVLEKVQEISSVSSSPTPPIPLSADTKVYPVVPRVMPPVVPASLLELSAPISLAAPTPNQTSFLISVETCANAETPVTPPPLHVSSRPLSPLRHYPPQPLPPNPAPASPIQRSKIPTPDMLFPWSEKRGVGFDFPSSAPYNFAPLAPTAKAIHHPPTTQPGGKFFEEADSLLGGSASDFHGLEQHIDALTVEKFSLQRSMEAAKQLADALGEENRGLMETFNQQGAAMAALREELEQRQEEVESLQLVATSALEDRDRAVEEAGGATERSQAMAKEVIGLEERVLQLRSSELKLEAALSSLRAEAESKKQLAASLERERTHAKQQLAGLYDEKRVLQFRLRRLTVGGVLNDLRPSNQPHPLLPLTQEAATSTEDLEAQAETGSWDRRSFPETSSSTPSEPSPPTPPPTTPADDPSPPSTTTLSEEQQEGRDRETGEGQVVGEGEGEGVGEAGVLGQPPSESTASASLERVTAVMVAAMAAARAVPPSPGSLMGGQGAGIGLPQMPDEAMESIGSLLEEILLEKQSLIFALAASEATANDLQVSNSEMSTRLSLQTQRLELACTQSMRESANRPSPSPTPRSRSLAEKEYTDESDEVAERVLSWLLGLLPGGRGA